MSTRKILYSGTTARTVRRGRPENYLTRMTRGVCRQPATTSTTACYWFPSLSGALLSSRPLSATSASCRTDMILAITQPTKTWKRASPYGQTYVCALDDYLRASRLTTLFRLLQQYHHDHCSHRSEIRHLFQHWFALIKDTHLSCTVHDTARCSWPVHE